MSAPILNMDVDGPCLDLVGSLIDELVKRNHRLPPDNHQCWHAWKFIQLLPERLRHAAYDILEQPRFWADLRPTDGAQEGIRAVRDAGIRVHWVTSPWTSCKTGWDAARRYALSRHFKHPDQDIKLDLCQWRNKQFVWANGFVDDKPDTVEEWQARHPEGLALLFKTRFTENHPFAGRRFLWDDVDMLIKELSGR